MRYFDKWGEKFNRIKDSRMSSVQKKESAKQWEMNWEHHLRNIWWTWKALFIFCFTSSRFFNFSNTKVVTQSLRVLRSDKTLKLKSASKYLNVSHFFTWQDLNKRCDEICESKVFTWSIINWWLHGAVKINRKRIFQLCINKTSSHKWREFFKKKKSSKSGDNQLVSAI